jgi:hypothetical protein
MGSNLKAHYQHSQVIIMDLAIVECAKLDERSDQKL